MNLIKQQQKFPLHWRIIVFLILGIAWGIYASHKSWGKEVTLLYIKPWGDIFLRLLKFVAIPLVLSSLIAGIARLKDVTKVVKLGGKTILLFLSTALISTTTGIILANVTKPGKGLPDALKAQLINTFGAKSEKAVEKAADIQGSPLQVIVDMFPDNVFGAASDNQKMIQVVFFAVLFGIALTKIDAEKSRLVSDFFEAINEALIKLVGMVMQVAPIGVFALMASVLVEAGDNIFQLISSLLTYSVTVLIGLILILFVVYPLLYTTLGRTPYFKFFKEMRPAFLVAFTTSSSNATLPVTMERVEKHLGVPEEITGFVLPFGTTINMDGTALYQAIAAVFIAQASNMDLSFAEMAIIALTATVAAAGAAGVPSAGIVTLVIVLESIGVSSAGIALIMAPDRILDMCRTVVNVAGDAVAAVVIAGSEKSHKEK